MTAQETSFTLRPAHHMSSMETSFTLRPADEGAFSAYSTRKKPSLFVQSINFQNGNSKMLRDTILVHCNNTTKETIRSPMETVSSIYRPHPQAIRASPFEPLVHHRNMRDGTISPLQVSAYKVQDQKHIEDPFVQEMNWKKYYFKSELEGCEVRRKNLLLIEQNRQRNIEIIHQKAALYEYKMKENVEVNPPVHEESISSSLTKDSAENSRLSNSSFFREETFVITNRGTFTCKDENDDVLSEISCDDDYPESDIDESTPTLSTDDFKSRESFKENVSKSIRLAAKENPKLMFPLNFSTNALNREFREEQSSLYVDDVDSTDCSEAREAPDGYEARGGEKRKKMEGNVLGTKNPKPNQVASQHKQMIQTAAQNPEGTNFNSKPLSQSEDVSYRGEPFKSNMRSKYFETLDTAKCQQEPNERILQENSSSPKKAIGTSSAAREQPYKKFTVKDDPQEQSSMEIKGAKSRTFEDENSARDLHTTNIEHQDRFQESSGGNQVASTKSSAEPSYTDNKALSKKQPSMFYLSSTCVTSAESMLENWQSKDESKHMIEDVAIDTLKDGSKRYSSKDNLEGDSKEISLNNNSKYEKNPSIFGSKDRRADDSKFGGRDCSKVCSKDNRLDYRLKDCSTDGSNDGSRDRSNDSSRPRTEKHSVTNDEDADFNNRTVDLSKSSTIMEEGEGSHVQNATFPPAQKELNIPVRFLEDGHMNSVYESSLQTSVTKIVDKTDTDESTTERRLIKMEDSPVKSSPSLQNEKLDTQERRCEHLLQGDILQKPLTPTTEKTSHNIAYERDIIDGLTDHIVAGVAASEARNDYLSEKGHERTSRVNGSVPNRNCEDRTAEQNLSSTCTKASKKISKIDNLLESSPSITKIQNNAELDSTKDSNGNGDTGRSQRIARPANTKRRRSERLSTEKALVVDNKSTKSDKGGQGQQLQVTGKRGKRRRVGGTMVASLQAPTLKKSKTRRTRRI